MNPACRCGRTLHVNYRTGKLYAKCLPCRRAEAPRFLALKAKHSGLRGLERL